MYFQAGKGIAERGHPYIIHSDCSTAYEYNLIPEGIDILLTHGPPLNVLDLVPYDGMKSAGCPKLAERIQKVRPKLHVFGHIHEGYGMHMKNGTTYVNASIYNNQIPGLLNKPIVLDWDDV